jgi:lipoprotein-anchoring transpeptidase ErfK/SrfK
VRHSGIWSQRSRGVIVTIVAGALCAGFGLTVVDAARPWVSTPRGAASPSATEMIAARRAALVAAVSFHPAPGATGVSLDAPVVVTTKAGHLTAVRVTTASVPQSSAALGGATVSAGRTWWSNGPLASATSYRVTATVADADGVTAQSSSTFRTLAPVAIVNATIFPYGGLSVGVAQPVVIHFDHYIDSDSARAAVLHHFTVTESRPVPGGWYWFSASELHFRPKAFWPTGEKVTVVSDLDGWNAGDGLWGQGSVVAQFSIGDARVSVANLATHRMTVTDNGRVVATYPFSGGKPTDPTMNGVHIVLDRESVVRMISSTNGIPVNSPDGYDELVYSDVHISDSGEYVHAAPWSVGSQGRTNVSHGCVNLSPVDALTFFAFSRVGDVVMVVGGPRPPARGDHGVMDWDTSWNQWTPAAVHSVPKKPLPPKPPLSHGAPRR